jgi:hypothetical protein
MIRREFDLARTTQFHPTLPTWQQQGCIIGRLAIVKTASVASWVSGLGFGLPGVYGVAHLARHGTIARFMGFPTYGEGPFERVVIKPTVPLLSAFVGVCATECVAGALLWRGRRSGAVLSLALLPVESAFWTGFALPFAPAFAAVRTASVWWNRSKWRRAGG